MKITAIKQQAKRQGRYSIFVDEEYAFSLSDTLLLESKLVKGQELTDVEVAEYKRLSTDGKVYDHAMRYIAMRPRSQWEITSYLERKGASPALSEQILNKLSFLRYVDDLAFAKAYVNDRRLLRPASRRKMMAELRKKHVADKIIEEAIGSEHSDEEVALLELVTRKRRQTRYQDDLKLMQYLARQGFNYDDIKSVLKADD